MEEAMSKINGKLISYWDDGSEYVSPATLDTETGEIDVHVMHKVPKDCSLVGEDFIDENGKIYEVCPQCHLFILKTEIVEGIGKHLYEEKRCMSEDCNYFSS